MEATAVTPPKISQILYLRAMQQTLDYLKHEDKRNLRTSEYPSFRFSVNMRRMAYEHVYKLLEKYGYSQRDMARLLNKSEGSISNIFTDTLRHRPIDPDEALKLALWLHTTPEYILYGTSKGGVAVTEEIIIGGELAPMDTGEIVAIPPKAEAKGLRVARVKGKAQAPAYPNGTLLYYYDHEDNVAPEAVDGTPAIVKTQDGRRLLRFAKANGDGLYDLTALNAPEEDGVKLAWASKVRYITIP